MGLIKAVISICVETISLKHIPDVPAFNTISVIVVIYVVSISTRIVKSIALVGISLQGRSVGNARLPVSVVVGTQVASVFVVNIDRDPVHCRSVVVDCMRRTQQSFAA